MDFANEGRNDTSHCDGAHGRTTRQLHVLVASADEAVRDSITSVLSERGHRVVGMASDGPETAGTVRRLGHEHPLDAAVVGTRPVASDAVQVVRLIAEAAPDAAVLLLTDDLPADAAASWIEDRAGRAGDAFAEPAVAAFLSQETPPYALDLALRVAVARTREMVALRCEAHEAREALEATKTIERAKGLLMRRTRCDELGAVSLLEHAAAAEGARSVLSIARQVVASEPTRPRAGERS